MQALDDWDHVAVFFTSSVPVCRQKAHRGCCGQCSHSLHCPTWVKQQKRVVFEWKKRKKHEQWRGGKARGRRTDTETGMRLNERSSYILHIWNPSTHCAYVCVCVCVCVNEKGYKTGRTEYVADEMFIYTSHKTRAHTCVLSAFSESCTVLYNYRVQRHPGS